MTRRIVAACLTATLEVVKEETSQEVDAPAVANAVDVEDQEYEGSVVANPNDKQIRFDTKRSCYEVIYADHAGVVRRSIRNLSVKRQGSRGKILSPEKCDELMTRVYQRAKQLWNELVRSDRPHYQ